MAIFHSHIFDNASGSVGNVTMCKYKGKSIAKGKIFFKKKKQSPAQVIQQTRFTVLSDLSYNFYAGIQAGFTRQYWSTERTRFIGLNQKKELYHITNSYITCSRGRGPYPGKRTHRLRGVVPSTPQSPRQRRGRHIFGHPRHERTGHTALPAGQTRSTRNEKIPVTQGFYHCQLRLLRVRPLPGEHESLRLQIHEYHTGIITGP